MRPSDVRELVEGEVGFPVTRETLVNQVGDRTIESPDGGSTSIEAVLRRAEESEYRSAEEVYETILANLGEEYVGRKHYDDRGRNYSRSEDESF